MSLRLRKLQLEGLVRVNHIVYWYMIAEEVFWNITNQNPVALQIQRKK